MAAVLFDFQLVVFLEGSFVSMGWMTLWALKFEFLDVSIDIFEVKLLLLGSPMTSFRQNIDRSINPLNIDEMQMTDTQIHQLERQMMSFSTVLYYYKYVKEVRCEKDLGFSETW